ncbi:exonuclease, partial [Xanthomonas vasicola]
MSVSADRLRLLRRQAGHADAPVPVMADGGDVPQGPAAVDAKDVGAALVDELPQPASGAAAQGM